MAWFSIFDRDKFESFLREVYRLTSTFLLWYPEPEFFSADLHQPILV